MIMEVIDTRDENFNLDLITSNLVLQKKPHQIKYEKMKSIPVMM